MDFHLIATPYSINLLCLHKIKEQVFPAFPQCGMQKLQRKRNFQERLKAINNYAVGTKEDNKRIKRE